MSDQSEESRQTEKPAVSRKPRSFFPIAFLLATLILTALIWEQSGAPREVETNYYVVVDLLRRDRLNGDSLEYLVEDKILRGRIRRPQGEKGPERFEISLSAREVEGKFFQELDRFNERFQDDPSKTIWPMPIHPRSGLWSALMALIPWVLIFGVIYFFFFRPLRMGGPGGGNMFSFGKSRARLASRESPRVTFADIAGIEEAKGDVQEIIEFLRNPGKFQRLGGRIPRGVILVGSPGTGKTLLAKAISGEAGVPFFSICGSDFVEMFVGVGASRVRDLFKQARENSPCIIFLDEVDAVGRRRGSGFSGAHDEREQTLNAILVEMDGFNSDEGIIVVAATNRPDILDPALLRPGRFDREIVIELPDLKGREGILQVHTRGVKLDPTVDLHRIARGTATFSGAELAALVNEAAIIAAMNDQHVVSEQDLEEARDKIRWGRQKTSRNLSEEDRTITAYHEAGHALVAHLLPETEPLHKVTIIPRGMALGATMQLPDRDQYHLSRKHILANITVLHAGRIAEKLSCDDITAGAKNDIERATELARLMVCEWGMSEIIGPVNYAALEGEFPRSRDHSEGVALKIDEEVRRIIEDCHKRGEQLIRKHLAELDRIARALLAKETLTGEEVKILAEGGEIEGPRAPGDPVPSGGIRGSRP